MGRQIAFRMTGEDARALTERLQQKRVQLLPWRLPSNEPSFLTSFEERGGPHLFLVRTEDLHLVRLRYVDTQGYWVVQARLSPVVELSPGGQDGDTIHPGRLHFNTNYFDEEGQLVYFPKDFLSWAQGLIEWIRRSYTRDPSTGFYDGPGARAVIAG